MSSLVQVAEYLTNGDVPSIIDLVVLTMELPCPTNPHQPAHLTQNTLIPPHVHHRSLSFINPKGQIGVVYLPTAIPGTNFTKGIRRKGGNTCGEVIRTALYLADTPSTVDICCYD